MTSFSTPTNTFKFTTLDLPKQLSRPLSASIPGPSMFPLFYTGIPINNVKCKLAIEPGTTMNIISTLTLSHANLQAEPHPAPYRVSWHNEHFHVTQRCLVAIKICSYEANLWCDVLPMNIAHILLGTPWVHGMNVRYSVIDNTYAFKYNNKTIKIFPTKPKDNAPSQSQSNPQPQPLILTHTILSSSSLAFSQPTQPLPLSPDKAIRPTPIPIPCAPQSFSTEFAPKITILDAHDPPLGNPTPTPPTHVIPHISPYDMIIPSSNTWISNSNISTTTITPPLPLNPKSQTHSDSSSNPITASISDILPPKHISIPLIFLGLFSFGPSHELFLHRLTFATNFPDLHKSIRQQLEKSNSKSTTQNNFKRLSREFEEGDYTFIHIPPKSFSYERMPVSRPSKIIRKIGLHVYHLVLPKNMHIKLGFNIEDCIPYAGAMLLAFVATNPFAGYPSLNAPQFVPPFLFSTYLFLMDADPYGDDTQHRFLVHWKGKPAMRDSWFLGTTLGQLSNNYLAFNSSEKSFLRSEGVDAAPRSHVTRSMGASFITTSSSINEENTWVISCAKEASIGGPNPCK